MKALVYDGIQKVQYREVPTPKIEKDDDIIIKVTSTSICGSDLHLVHGLAKEMYNGFILGHETMGIIEEIGKNVNNLRKGDRVIVPFPVACGHCFYCNHQEFSQCNNTNEYGEVGGLLGAGKLYGDYAGGQAEYLRVPHANVGPKKVPNELSDEQVLFLTDILPTSLWGTEIANVKKDDTVVVLGCGPVGLLTIKWCILKGAKRVIAVDRVEYRLKHAKGYGAEIVNFEEYDQTGAYIKEITSGGADCVIDCVGVDGKMSLVEKLETALKLQGGSKSAIEIASQAVRKCGHVALVGVYGTKYNNFPLGNFFTKNITLKMGQCPATRYVEPILKKIKNAEFDATDIITHKLPLKQGKYAYEIFDAKKDNCIKVILKP
ncbi:MAG: zinc-dependent alcohol dehydrogenase [Clostridia bacterium]